MSVVEQIAEVAEEKLREVEQELEFENIEDLERTLSIRPEDFIIYHEKSDPIVIDKKTGIIYHY